MAATALSPSDTSPTTIPDRRPMMLWACASEHDRATLVHEHAIVELAAHRAREHHALEVTPHPLEIRDGVAMPDPRHGLLDDRPLVKRLGHVVGGCADQLHAAL